MKRLAAIALAGALLGCNGSGAKYNLEGSLSEEMDLGYDEAVLTFSGDQFAIGFNRKKGQGFDTVLQVGVRLDPTTMEQLKGGITWNLAKILTTNVVRGTLSRNVLDDPRTMFPPFRECGSEAPDGAVLMPSCAELTLFNVPAEGKKLQAAGNFHITFANGVEFASGRTVFGDFNASFP
jgi:hypothetical protein